MWWLLTLAVAIAALCPVAGTYWLPPVAEALPILGGGLLLRRRELLALLVVVTIGIVYDELILGWHVIRVGQLVVVVAVAVFAYRLARTRETLGVQGLRGESMLLELRNRLRAQGEMPELPPGWQHEIVIRSAGAGSFGGDFLVAARTGQGDVLEVVLVDVSGKGIDAGTRALLLSGALGGLLGAVPPEQFLPAANDYLLRQAWSEGFATAVHLVVDLSTGNYVVESAGHPPAVHFVKGSGMWRLIDSEGTVLGVLPEASYTSAHGVLGPRRRDADVHRRRRRDRRTRDRRRYRQADRRGGTPGDTGFSRRREAVGRPGGTRRQRRPRARDDLARLTRSSDVKRG